MSRESYNAKLTTPDKAVELIKSEHVVAIGMVTAEPAAILQALSQRLRGGDLKKIKFFTAFPQKTAMKTVLAPELCDCVEVISQFVSGGERGLVQTGLNYYLPNHFHQVPRLLTECIKPEVVATTVSPMDKAGFFSLGLSNEYTSVAARAAKVLIVEVNENMPRIFGQSLLHVSEVSAIVENHIPLIEAQATPPKPEDEVIGRIISEMVPDGATLQLGVGGLPNSVAAYLDNHKDLGIHTEVMVPGLIDLVKKGVATGAKKSRHPWKHVFTVAVGDRAMYEFMDDNPSMETYPVSYVNHPAVVAQNDLMISINSIIEVDLLGQCNSESINGRQYSGAGGQLDFVRGAYDSKGGKSILAFHATTHQGAVSRIVPRLEAGVMVTTPRMDVHWLVTEFGAANLKGKTTRERALAIIDLAHPKFREDLLRAAEEMYLL